MSENDRSFRMTIDGRAVDSSERFEVINPATEEVIATAPDASRKQLDETVSAARTAAAGWARESLQRRQASVRAMADRMTEELDALAALLTREQGKPLAEARSEITRAAHWMREIAGMAPPVQVLADTADKLVEVRRVPLGVVAAFVPWNFPVSLAAWKIAPALVTGNTVIHKPSPFTPLTALRIGELMRELVPAGVFNVVSGTDRLGPWLSEHPGVDKIAFTGSTPTGRSIMRSASTSLKRITLELGGNDAAIVLDDADVEAWAPRLFWAAFANNAQFCLASKRMFVHDRVYDRFARALLAYARAVRMGDGSAEGVRIGPVQNRPQFERLSRLLAESRSAGIRFLLGGDVPDGRGFFVPIAIADDPPDDARIVAEEAFGPILPLLRFHDDDEVVRRANATEYGLGASIWTRNLDRARQLASRLQAGTVWINTVHELSPHYPFAGHKQSGFGCENGQAGFLEYTQLQTVMTHRSAVVVP